MGKNKEQPAAKRQRLEIETVQEQAGAELCQAQA
jgi:hypothetical protein